MSKISWLHLSDLHLGRDVYNEKIVLEKLLADIKTQIEINNIELNLYSKSSIFLHFEKKQMQRMKNKELS